MQDGSSTVYQSENATTGTRNVDIAGAGNPSLQPSVLRPFGRQPSGCQFAITEMSTNRIVLKV
jgi:hypothetical protein